MFTITDILNIAIQIEKNGEESYRNASKIAKDPEVAKMLNWMADEEKCHAKWFEAFPTNRPLTAEQGEMEAMGRSLLQEMVKGNTFLLAQSELEQMETVMEVLDRSVEFERDTILFYEFLLGIIDDRETMQQLQRIIEEERKHLSRLELVGKSIHNTSQDALSS
ncbi:MAG: Rbr2 [uncultured bacterium]|nr:MAG: Rbr2 [uncultured bacterium]